MKQYFPYGEDPEGLGVRKYGGTHGPQPHAMGRGQSLPWQSDAMV